jgi:hypothetical protein
MAGEQQDTSGNQLQRRDRNGQSAVSTGSVGSALPMFVDARSKQWPFFSSKANHFRRHAWQSRVNEGQNIAKPCAHPWLLP